jgi:ATP-dependent Lon protease
LHPVTVTGQIGDVMRESAQAALSWVRGHAATAGLESDWFAERDVHIHVPAGAVPKDGPSAGTAMATALVSLATGVPVSEDVAMTGEITLTGQVLPIGGVKEKALARSGRGSTVIPEENRLTWTTSRTFARRCVRACRYDRRRARARVPGRPC